MNNKAIDWEDRLLVIRSHSYAKSMQNGLHRRLDKAETALKKLTPVRQRGKRQIKDEQGLLDAIADAEFEAGWRIYATNALVEELSLTQAVLAYRNQYIEANIIRRLQGKFLSITPVYVQRDDHAQRLFHLLTLGARLLALGDYQAK